jgi:hypothetical protein
MSCDLLAPIQDVLAREATAQTDAAELHSKLAVVQQVGTQFGELGVNRCDHEES